MGIIWVIKGVLLAEMALLEDSYVHCLGIIWESCDGHTAIMRLSHGGVTNVGLVGKLLNFHVIWTRGMIIESSVS